MSSKRGILYVGGDDSNHAGTTKGEIIVGTFSFLKEDSLVQNFENRRNYQKTLRWLENPLRDYRSTALVLEKYRHSSQNLVEIIPKLTEKYIIHKRLNLEQINIYLDGRLDRGSREQIRNFFREKLGIEKVVVDNFLKKNKNKNGRMEKHPFCPPLVYYADVIANNLNTLHSYLELTKSEKFMVLK